MIDPNLYIIARTIDERRIEEALRRQRHWQPPAVFHWLHRDFRIEKENL